MHQIFCLTCVLGDLISNHVITGKLHRYFHSYIIIKILPEHEIRLLIQTFSLINWATLFN